MYECPQCHFHLIFNISQCLYVVPNYEMVTVGGFCFMGVNL